MRHFSTISSLLLLGTTVSLLITKWTINHQTVQNSAEDGYHLYL
ncbi:hypothetical protein ABID22_003602 [Pontibacter aydingkolensis]|nr:hypothetical protein [Pontibacter aydingkolensis]